ncbi:MAG: NAD(+) synthase [Tannerellaceae bacterium]|jgi:NAD+ synthase (glutamine-hydrolysing)|nr:NAD(+) synthase [Tannerellaceae bacterium]
MNHGFIKVAAASPHVSTADCFANVEKIGALMRRGAAEGVQVMVFPELSVTGYTCMDLFSSRTLITCAEEALKLLAARTKDVDMLVIVGVPLRVGDCLVNAAVVLQGGRVLGVVPKSYLPNYKEFQERRWFTPGVDIAEDVVYIGGEPYPMSCRLLFTAGEVGIGIEICEDLWAPVPPSSLLAMDGANLIFNLSASNELTGKHAYRRSLVAQQSGRCIAGYVYAMAGRGESTTDLVFAGGGIIAENGVIIKESGQFPTEEIVFAEIDIANLNHDRLVNLSFTHGNRLFPRSRPVRIPFLLPKRPNMRLTRRIEQMPFVPAGKNLSERCEEIFNILVAALMQRLMYINAASAVIGVSGGLDSTLALLATAMTFERMKKPGNDIIAITMPGFGTTGRTYNNAVRLAAALGVSLREIPIKEACMTHFRDIAHDPDNHNVVYENSQARERTQILMDVANQTNGIVIGTGDMSELALGWATFNGDHISMYGLNAGIPKTLVRHLVEWVARNRADEVTKDILLDIAATPISPELIPADESGNIIQKTEGIVGPYELHDFFLYHTLRFGASPERISYLAQLAFEGKYEKEEIERWLDVFIKRFFQQQYKRNCLPDGPKIGSVSLSPRGDWRMPSDALPTAWKLRREE